MAGKLIVFEGPDGTGKTSLVDAVFSRMHEKGLEAEREWFPGRRSGSLGKHVYRLHHNKEEFGVKAFTASSLQAMHIAAHLDLIESIIKPRIADGITVVLDRFWWSTWVYGLTFGADEKVLKHLVLSEQALLGELRPSAVFLIERKESLKDENLSLWKQLSERYRDLLIQEESKYPCFKISNDGAFDDTFQGIVDILHKQNIAT